MVICPSVCPSIRPSTHPYICPSFHPSIHPSVHLKSVHESDHSFTCPSIHPPICPSICPWTHGCFHVSAAVHNAVMTIGTLPSVLGTYPGMESLGHVVILCFVFEDWPCYFPWQLYPPPTVAGVQFSHILTKAHWCLLLGEQLSHVGVRWGLLVVLTCISLMLGAAQHCPPRPCPPCGSATMYLLGKSGCSGRLPTVSWGQSICVFALEVEPSTCHSAMVLSPSWAAISVSCFICFAQV